MYITPPINKHSVSVVMRETRGETGGSGASLKNHQRLLYVFLGILVQTPLEKQLDHSGASGGRFVPPSVKYIDDLKKNKKTRGPEGPEALT